MKTWALLSAQPAKHLEWTLFCAPVMLPEHKDIIDPRPTTRLNPLVSEADVPPAWTETNLFWVPFLGPLYACMRNAAKYQCKLEDCADFVAGELETGGAKYVGKRVGVFDAGGEKTK